MADSMALLLTLGPLSLFTFLKPHSLLFFLSPSFSYSFFLFANLQNTQIVMGFQQDLRTETRTHRVSQQQQSSTAAVAFPEPPECISSGLNLINSIRRKHGAASLNLDPRLCLDAYKDADAMAKNSERPTRKEGSKEVGRCMCTLSGGISSPTEAIEKAINTWAEKEEAYNFGDPLASPLRANVFSELVWKSSKEVGIGIAKEGQTWAVVALFSPPGNKKNNDEHRRNVSRALY